MKFEAPYLLLLLVPLAALWRLRASRPASSVEKRRLPLLVFSIACLVLALARPYWSTTTEKKVVKGADFIILLDVSQSMFCPDERGLRRIDEARNFLHQLLPEFSGSSIALIYFAGDAQIGCPLTDDQAAVRLFLDSVSPAMTGQPGTNPDQLQRTLSGFMQALKSSPIHNPKRQIALLFSDGEFSNPSDKFGIWIKGQRNLSLFTFACGKGKAAVPNFQLTGPYPGAFSEAAPKNLEALSTGPFYDLAAGGPPGILADVTSRVNDEVAGGKQIPLYQYVPFLILSFCFLLGYQIYPLLARMEGRPGMVISIAALVLLLTTLSMSREEKLSLFQQAIKDLNQRRYSGAVEKLQRLRKEGGSEELDVAMGNAHFLQQEYDQAISFYEQALQRNPGNLAARWNWEVALKRQQTPHNNPPPAPPQRRPAPQEIPKETQALLKYFDQKEKEQMQLTNAVNAHTENFAW
jgi:tetratricopeptide (TPR) repeat protein